MNERATPVELASRVALGERAAVAAALNLVEDRRASAEAGVVDLARALAKLAGDGALGRRPVAHRVGVTGPPGVGKSSLLAALARAFRRSGRTVGVLAVDPSSPRSGGAVLGDRVRIDPDPDDEGLFVRSMAAQGDLGGLARAAALAVDVLGAAYDVALVETTGVGQSEVEVEGVVDTTLVVVQPGSGDALQFYKAGILEVADLFLVSKSDLGAIADRSRRDLVHALGRARPILAASARTGLGLDALVAALDAHRESVAPSFRARRARGAVAQIVALVVRRHGEHGAEMLGGRAELARRAERAVASGIVPTEAARALGDEVLARIRSGG